MNIYDELARAEKYANELEIERQVAGYDRIVDGGTTQTKVIADQGLAMRGLIYHCTAAIVVAIQESRS